MTEHLANVCFQSWCLFLIFNESLKNIISNKSRNIKKILNPLKVLSSSDDWYSFEGMSMVKFISIYMSILTIPSNFICELTKICWNVMVIINHLNCRLLNTEHNVLLDQQSFFLYKICTIDGLNKSDIRLIRGIVSSLACIFKILSHVA
jgi:hypothetical protein